MNSTTKRDATSVMVALLPTNTEWTNLDLPHLTLVYAGKVADLKTQDYNKLSKQVSDLAGMARPLGLKVVSRELFGDGEEQVEAFRLRPTYALWAMRRFVQDWNRSEYPFNPHVTIGPPGTYVENVPRYLRFTKIMLAWGTDQLVFSLNGGDYPT